MPELMKAILMFAGFAILGLTFVHRLKYTSRRQLNAWEAYFEKERDASFVTKKSFPLELVLTMELDKIPQVDEPRCLLYYDKLLAFQNKQMVDLRGLSNLELKKQYGVNYFSQLMQAEEVFLQYLNGLNNYAYLLIELEKLPEAEQLVTYLTTNKWANQKVMGAFEQLKNQKY